MFRSTRRPTIAPAEQLELRILPTVKVNFNPGSGLLKITGDNAANEIELAGLTTPGSLQVFIEGNLFDDYSGVNSLKINLKGGNDILFISALSIPGNSTVKLGSGADEIDIDDVNSVGAGPNQNVVFGGAFNAVFGKDAGDFLELDGGVQFNNAASFKGVADVDLKGAGTSAGIQTEDVTFFGDLTIQMSGLGDSNGDVREIEFDNVNVTGKTTILGSNSLDRGFIASSLFQGQFNISLKGGNDILDINDGLAAKNLFTANTVFDGGSGDDTIDKGPDNLFTFPENILGFETIL